MIKLTLLIILAALSLPTAHTVLFSGPEKGTVIIGEQVWMVRNLDVSTFRNGDPVPRAKSEAEWEAAGKNGRPAWCYYENETAIGDGYGKLYNWYALNDPRILAPPGWHVPDAAEWQRLVDFNGGDNLAAGKLKEVGTQHWFPPNKGARNESGFCAIPGGYRDRNGKFFSKGIYAAFWSSTAADRNIAIARHMSRGDRKVYLNYVSKIMGFSVRCIKN